MSSSILNTSLPPCIFNKKKKQIDSLKIFCDDVREIQPGVEYHILFHIGTQQMTLRIQLPTEFPKQQPLIWTNPTVQHNWVTDNGRIMSPGLVNYSEHSELGQIVLAIIRELKKNTKEHQANSLWSEGKALSSSQFNHQYFPIPPFIPELESLSHLQVERLNVNKDILDQFVEELPQASAVVRDVENNVDTVEQLAKSVQEHQQRLEAQRQNLIEKYEELNKLKLNWDLLNSQLQSSSQRYLPNNIEVSLQEAAATAEEESEVIAETFLAGKMDIDSFLQTYTASRMLSHTRKTKEEILHKQLLELQRLGY